MSLQIHNIADFKRINLVCEDRNTGKKCQFKDLKINLLSDGHFHIQELISQNISLHYFLNNSMIFQSCDDMDIVIGFYPSDELLQQKLTIDSSPSPSLSFKFEKIRTSQSNKQEKISFNHNTNLIPNNNNNNQTCFQIKNETYGEEEGKELVIGTTRPQSNHTEEESICSEKPLQNPDIIEDTHKKINDLSQIQIDEHLMESEDVSAEQKSSSPLENRIEICSNENQHELMKNLSPCTSYTENEMPQINKQQSAVTNDITVSDISDINNCTSINSKLPVGVFGQLGQIGTHNSSFHAYNPLLSTSGSSNSSQKNSDNVSGGGYQFLPIPFCGNPLTSSDNLQGNANSCRQSRNKERTIKEAIEMVTKWRDLQEEYRQKHQVKGLQEVADELNISKKVLDYYFQELRTAEFFGFDFDLNLANKMGVLRKFIEEQKKNHENKNKNFKITRNLQFKYRLKNYIPTSRVQLDSSVLSSKEKLQNNHHTDTNSVKVEDAPIESCSPSIDNFNNNVINSNNIDNNTNVLSSTTAQMQDIFTQNSPIFLSLMNNHTNANINTNTNQINSINIPNNNIPSTLFNNQNQLINQSNSLICNNNFGFNASQKSYQQQNQGIDKALLLFELLNSSASPNIQQEPKNPSSLINSCPTNNNNNNSNNNNLFDDILSFVKLFSSNNDAHQIESTIPLIRSHSTSSALHQGGFISKKIFRPQKIAEVIQIRKQDD